MTAAAAATDLVRATAFVHPSSFQGCKGGLVSCLLSLPLSNVASPRSPAGLPSLTVGARPSDSVFPIQPPRHEITKTMPSHEVSSEMASWHFFFFFSSHSLSATATVTLFGKSNNVGRGTKRASALLPFTSVGRREGGRSFRVREKFSRMHLCTSDSGSPSCYSNVWVLFFRFFCRRHVFSMCGREFQRENGFSELSPAHTCTAASQVSNLWRRLDLVRHKSQVLCMNLQY